MPEVHSVLVLVVVVGVVMGCVCAVVRVLVGVDVVGPCVIPPSLISLCLGGVAVPVLGLGNGFRTRPSGPHHTLDLLPDAPEASITDADLRTSACGGWEGWWSWGMGGMMCVPVGCVCVCGPAESLSL